MNQPKDYAPHMTLSELAEQHAARLERNARWQRWTGNALLFMAGVATGTTLVGTLIWGF